MILINSYGGAGTTVLIEQLRQSGVSLIFDGTDETKEAKIFKHFRMPVPSDCLGKRYENGKSMKITKAIYLYANPIDAIKTFYRKRQYQVDNEITQSGSSGSWVTLHCFNIAGNFKELSDEWNIEHYAAELQDYLCLESHFCHWASAEKLRSSGHSGYQKANYPIMYLKYESLWENLEKVRSFLGLSEEFVDNFPPKRERQNFDIDDECYNNLMKTYARLIDMQNSWPDCVILNKGVS